MSLIIFSLVHVSASIWLRTRRKTLKYLSTFHHPINFPRKKKLTRARSAEVINARAHPTSQKRQNSKLATFARWQLAGVLN